MMGRRDGQVGLLHFKEADGDTWKDSGEGGLYAYLVVPTCLEDEDEKIIKEREDHLERCVVETLPTLKHAHLVSSSGHIEPFAAERDLWPDLYKENLSDWGGVQYKYPVPVGDNIKDATKDEIRQMTEHYLHAYQGGPFYAVVYLGSSGPSVFNDTQVLPPLDEPHTFWPIYTRDDLTAEGKVLYDTLWLLYGIEPVILLFLDT